MRPRLAVLTTVLVGALCVAVVVPSAAAPRLGGDERPDPVAGYLAPVAAPITDVFRLPEGQYGAGNRGLEYDTAPGQRVRTPAAGVVTFAGVVVGRLAVTVQHDDGRRSSLTGLATLAVHRGDALDRGDIVGTAGEMLHFGVRVGDTYVDPAPLLERRRRRAVLVATFVPD